MESPAPLRLAIAQVAPVFNNRAASLEKLVTYTREAMDKGATSSSTIAK